MSPKATIILTPNQVVQIVRHDASKDVEILRRGFRTTLDQEHLKVTFSYACFLI